LNKHLAVFLTFGVCAAAFAQAPAAPPAAASAPRKIATIHVQNAIVSTKEGQKATQELGTKFNSRRQSLEKKQSDLAAMQNQMRSGGATMSAAAKDKLTRDIDANTTSLRRETEDFQSDVQQEEGKIMNDLGQKMMDIIGKYATANGIALVVDVSNPQSPVLWADASLDITNDIVKQYDAAHPGATVPGGTLPPTPVPPTTKKQ
jgi:outer membrane protein